MKKISVVVPCYNEEETIESFYNAICAFWNQMGDYEPEYIFIDDGSKDKTCELAMQLAKRDEHVRYTSFSRNFGKEAAVFCGLKQATGDAVVVIDADLQHPVETIKDMAMKWEEGYDIVEGMKSTRGKESATHGFFAGLFYKLISSMIGFDMNNSSDFKLMDRRVVDTLNTLTEKDTFFRALSYWVGFKSTYVEYEVHERVGGESKWSSLSLIKYAVRNLTSFTYAPLHIIAYLGIIIIMLGIGLGIDAVISYAHGNAIGGYPSLVILIVLATGAIMTSLGIIALYISKMYEELKNRPRYIVRDHN
ncbi:MAG: glycosyltransferase family 2 protein [Lachnospiraceae bacterium]|nr:glycosyltransferase family 2 protein [Candidatus Colinaster equi]